MNIQDFTVVSAQKLVVGDVVQIADPWGKGIAWEPVTSVIAVFGGIRVRVGEVTQTFDPHEQVIIRRRDYQEG